MSSDTETLLPVAAESEEMPAPALKKHKKKSHKKKSKKKSRNAIKMNCFDSEQEDDGAVDKYGNPEPRFAKQYADSGDEKDGKGHKPELKEKPIERVPKEKAVVAADRKDNNSLLANMLEGNSTGISANYDSEEEMFSVKSYEPRGTDRRSFLGRMRSYSNRSLDSQGSGSNEGVFRQSPSPLRGSRRRNSGNHRPRRKLSLTRKVRQHEPTPVDAADKKATPEKPKNVIVTPPDDSEKSGATALDTSEREDRSLASSTEDTTIFATKTSDEEKEGGGIEVLKDEVVVVVAEIADDAEQDQADEAVVPAAISVAPPKLSSSPAKSKPATAPPKPKPAPSPQKAATPSPQKAAAPSSQKESVTKTKRRTSLSFRGSRGNRPTMKRAMSTSALLHQQPLCSSKSILKKDDTVPSLKRQSSVRFDSVQTREFARTIGDNPSVSCGIPIGLDWKYNPETIVKDLEDYEDNRGPRRARENLALTPSAREYMLLKDWGVTFRELHETNHETDLIKQGRWESATQTDKQARVEEILETTKRRVGRVVTGTTKKREQERLWKRAQNVREQIDA